MTGPQGSAQVHWLHGDRLGKPVLTTDAAGAVVSTVQPYAVLGYPGQFRTFTDLWYNKHRDYDPTTGRYIQADPIGLAGDENPYAYARGNELRYVDPEGKLAWVVPVVIGAGLEFGRQAYFRWSQGQSISELSCYNWTQVGLGGALGATGMGWFRPVLKLTKGSPMFNNVSRRLRRANQTPANEHLHHAFLPRWMEKLGNGRFAPVVNHPMNLRAVQDSVHREIHKSKWPTALDWRGMPEWARGSVVSTGAGAGTEALDGD